MTTNPPGPSAGYQRSLLSFLRTEVGGASLLLAATVIALIWANSPWASSYVDLWSTELRLGIGSFAIEYDLGHWVNDGLMVLFFFVVGLEVRRELVFGDLRNPRVAAVPALAALGGMLVPAALYVAINAGGPGAHGWGIVMATDIAFVLGAMALLGSRVSAGTRLFLLTLAIVDDIGAIAVIAIFYSSSVEVAWLGVAAAILVVTVFLIRFGDARRPHGWGWPFYLVTGLALWIATVQSGVHPTIAGVAMGLIVVVRPRADGAGGLGTPDAPTPSERFQAAVHPWSSFVVIPLFALANAGVALGDGVLSRALTSPVTIGVVVGLVVGKLLGVALFSLGAVRFRIGLLPPGMRRRHAFGAGGLAGIGFTVSLFVADLAFEDALLRDEAKIGVLIASVIAVTLGSLLFSRARSRDDAE
ncbi:MAG: Na+/H+ antiporter NhaA [Patulibacter sp.]|nr:Na+/H+ antiporter NhaA [Patulibacter sp.]